LVDGDADNLRPGNLLGLPRRAHSFGRKGRRALVESRDREALAVLRRCVNSMARAINVTNARPNNQGVANVYPILTWVRIGPAHTGLRPYRSLLFRQVSGALPGRQRRQSGIADLVQKSRFRNRAGGRFGSTLFSAPG
jgi:hypothetical protein